MKFVAFAFLLVLVGSPLSAQESSSLSIPAPGSRERPKPEWREFATADVRDISFNATTGFLLFTVDGMRYRHSPRYDFSSMTGASVSAIAATLTELRQAKRFKVSIDPPQKDATLIPVIDLVILYEALK